MKEIFTRRSVRKYDLTKKLTREELKDVIRAAFAAPSARNQQTKNFIIIDDLDIIEQISHVSKGSMIVKNCNTIIGILGQYEGLINPEMQPTDLSAAQMNMMTYARSKDLGTCWLGVYPIEERMESLNKILNVPSHLFVYSLLAIGYPENLDVFKEIDKFDEDKIFYNRF